MIIIDKKFRLHDLDYSVDIISATSIKIRIDKTEETFYFSGLDDGVYDINDCKELHYLPFEFVEVKEGNIFVSLFFDDWYKKSESEMSEDEKLKSVSLARSKNILIKRSNASK